MLYYFTERKKLFNRVVLARSTFTICWQVVNRNAKRVHVKSYMHHHYSIFAFVCPFLMTLIILSCSSLFCLMRLNLCLSFPVIGCLSTLPQRMHTVGSGRTYSSHLLRCFLPTPLWSWPRVIFGNNLSLRFFQRMPNFWDLDFSN